MSASDRVIETFTVLATIVMIACTCIIYSKSPQMLRQTAVWTVLVITTFVLIFEIAFHFTRPRSDELAFGGPEVIVIAVFVVYEYTGTILQLEQCKGSVAGARFQNCFEWFFASMGVLLDKRQDPMYPSSNTVYRCLR